MGAEAPVGLMCQLDRLGQVVAENASAVILAAVVLVVLVANIDASNVTRLIEKVNNVTVCFCFIAVAVVCHLETCFVQLVDCVDCLHDAVPSCVVDGSSITHKNPQHNNLFYRYFP